MIGVGVDRQGGQAPGLSASNAIVTVPSAGTRTVSRIAPAMRLPLSATTWK